MMILKLTSFIVALFSVCDAFYLPAARVSNSNRCYSIVLPSSSSKAIQTNSLFKLSGKALKNHAALRQYDDENSYEDDEDDETATYSGKLTIEDCEYAEEFPQDIYDSKWRLNCKLIAIGETIDNYGDYYELSLPAHLKLDGTVGTATDEMIIGTSNWKTSVVDGEEYVSFAIGLKNLDDFLPDGTFYFNARLNGDEYVGYELIDGIISTKVVYDNFNPDKAQTGKLSARPYTAGIITVGTFSTDPVDFENHSVDELSPVLTANLRPVVQPTK